MRPCKSCEVTRISRITIVIQIPGTITFIFVVQGVLRSNNTRQKIEMKFERCGNSRSRNLTCKFGTSTHQVESVNSIENALIASLRTIFGCRLSTLAAPVAAGNRSAFAG